MDIIYERHLNFLPPRPSRIYHRLSRRGEIVLAATSEDRGHVPRVMVALALFVAATKPQGLKVMPWSSLSTSSSFNKLQIMTVAWSYYSLCNVHSLQYLPKSFFSEWVRIPPSPLFSETHIDYRIDAAGIYFALSFCCGIFSPTATKTVCKWNGEFVVCEFVRIRPH